MKIGVVSDTHRNKKFLAEVVAWMQKNHRISALYHLGDDYDDVIDLSDRFLEIVQVPGIYDPRYTDGTLGAVVKENVMGIRIALVHSAEKDLTDEIKSSSDIILYGHTHKPELQVIDGKLFMNPGHLKAEKDKTVPASFGILDIQDRNMTASIYGLNYKTVETARLMRSEQGLFKA
jgi:putative phosphoesterase